MSAEPTDSGAVQKLVQTAIASISDAKVAKITSLQRSPIQQALNWDYGNDERYVAWRFADLGERDVWAAYCTGHGQFGHPWGLVYEDSDYFGMGSGWYPELHHPYQEWFA